MIRGLTCNLSVSPRVEWVVPKVGVLALAACLLSACASNPRPARVGLIQPDVRLVVHVLNRIAFGPRPDDVDRVTSVGLNAYIERQLHPERIPDDALEATVAPLTALQMSARTFAVRYYRPMTIARQEFANTQKTGPAPSQLPHLRGHLLPIAAMSLPGDKPVTVLQQAPATAEEVWFQRQNQEVFDELQTDKLFRAVYSERQLQEVLTDFWFNHFNVDARKIEERAVVVEYERDVIRPRVLGRFRDLLGAVAKSPAMLFYLDNWLSKGRALNENYGRELLELHTLGVDGGYTQKDVVDVARCFTGWTMKDPHDGSGFVFDARTHDRGAKRVLGHTIKAGRGVEDGEAVLDLLARHPSTAHFLATKLVRRFVADDPPRALVKRAARTYRRTDGDLREVVRTILTAPEFFSAAAYRAKVKTPFEFVASALRATDATVINPRPFAATIGAMGEPLYQCQPPTGYGDRAALWTNSSALVSRINFAVALAANGVNAAKLGVRGDAETVKQLAHAVLAGDVPPETRTALESAAIAPNRRLGLLLGSPEFQRR
jgi:uncharacterized protein (DUF1800 family)